MLGLPRGPTSILFSDFTDLECWLHTPTLDFGPNATTPLDPLGDELGASKISAHFLYGLPLPFHPKASLGRLD